MGRPAPYYLVSDPVVFPCAPRNLPLLPGGLHGEDW